MAAAKQTNISLPGIMGDLMPWKESGPASVCARASTSVSNAESTAEGIPRLGIPCSGSEKRRIDS